MDFNCTSWHASFHTTGTPLAVLCKDAHIEETDNFNPAHKKVYKNKVLGSLHGTVAQQELLQDYPGKGTWNNIVQYLKIDTNLIYSKHSSNTQAMNSTVPWQMMSACDLARHNINGHFNHAMTHCDYVSLLFSSHLTRTLTSTGHHCSLPNSAECLSNKTNCNGWQGAR